MSVIWERCNRLDYSATKDAVMTVVKTKPGGHTRVWVRVSAAPFEALTTSTFIPLSVIMNGSSTTGDQDSPTSWKKQTVRFKSSADADTGTWFEIPFLFQGWSNDEMVLNILIARMNSATDTGTHSTVPLLVRRVYVYTSI